MLKPFERKVIFWAALLAAPVFILFAIFHFGVPVPYWDQWELVPLLEKAHDHTLTFADLWAQHNEHRIVLPLAVMLLLDCSTGWNIYYEFLTSYILAIAIFAFLWSIAAKTFQNRPPLWLAVAFSLVVFSPVQYENWLWGWQIQFFMTILGTVAAVWSLQRWPGMLKGLLIAIAAAVFATFSLSSGLFVWVAAVPMLLFARPRNWRLLAGWVLAAAATICVYLYHYVKPVEHPPLTLFVQNPLEFVRYVLIYLGSPLGFISPAGTTCMGIAILLVAAVVFALILRRDRDESPNLLPWLALGAQAIICAGATGIARLGFSARQALSSRYSTIASLLLLATLVIVARWLAMPSKSQKTAPDTRRTAAFVLLAAFGLTYIATFIAGVGAMQQRCSLLTICQQEWMAYPNTRPEALWILYPRDREQVIRQRTETLGKLGFILPHAPEASQADKRP
jgi:hypothetical protein